MHGGAPPGGAGAAAGDGGELLQGFDARFKRQAAEGTDNAGTYGLKTREEFAKATEIAKKREGIAAGLNDEDGEGEEDEAARKRKRRKMEKKIKKEREKAKRKARTLLSFADDGDEEEEGGQQQQQQQQEQGDAGREEGEVLAKAAVVTKNPEVDTTFLPDRERDEQREREVKRLKREWAAEQERAKEETIQVAYSFWDGNGHRRTTTLKRGTTVEQFLEQARTELLPTFPQLRAASADTLMYIKEDKIIPHETTFYDLIAGEARGKAGPIVSFDVRSDVRLVGDVREPTKHSHAGKVCERHWYERNKHIFPVCRWEPLDLDAVVAEIVRKRAAYIRPAGDAAPTG